MANIEGLEGNFRGLLDQLLAEFNGQVWVVSGFRDVEEQQFLWSQKAQAFGLSPNIGCNDPGAERIREWVACPGKSNHNRGLAADLGYANDNIRKQVHARARSFGLHFPMDWEPWHIEPIGVSTGTYIPMGHDDDHSHLGEPPFEAYTTPQRGESPVGQDTTVFGQLNNIMAILAGGNVLEQIFQARATEVDDSRQGEVLEELDQRLL